MKTIFYATCLILTISSDFVHSGYMFFGEDYNIEFSKDFSSEKESKENLEVDQEVCEFSLYHFNLMLQKDDITLLHDSPYLKSNTTYHTIPSPPPDKPDNCLV